MLRGGKVKSTPSPRAKTGVWQYKKFLLKDVSLSYKGDQKRLLQNGSHLYQGVRNDFWKQEMELSKQEIKLFLIFPGLCSKMFFCKMLPNSVTVGSSS